MTEPDEVDGSGYAFPEERQASVAAKMEALSAALKQFSATVTAAMGRIVAGAPR